MAIKFDFRKQKIRGWKRRVRAVENWVSYYKELDLKTLEERNGDYVKLWLAPFYSLIDYTLPNWYKRLLVNALLEVYHSWDKSMKEIGEPYYLKIWLLKKDFIRSQVVVSFRDSLHSYDTLFSELKSVPTLPPELMQNAAKQVPWNQGIFLTPRLKSELLEDIEDGFLTKSEMEEIVRSAHTIEETDTDTIYLVLEETVWVGG